MPLTFYFVSLLNPKYMSSIVKYSSSTERVLLALDHFLEKLGHIDHFWDLDRLVEDGAPGEVEIVGSLPIFVGFLGLGFM
jgi:hypothetical protein